MVTTLIIILTIVILIVALNIYNYIRLKKAPTVAENPKIVQLTDKTFNQHTKSSIAVVDFWAEWCMPCKMMMPILNDLASDDSLPIKVFKVNVDQQHLLAAKFSIKGIPTLIIFKNGKEVKRLVGAKTKDLIVKEIKKLSL